MFVRISGVRHIVNEYRDNEVQTECGSKSHLDSPEWEQPIGHDAEGTWRIIQDDPDLCAACKKAWYDGWMDDLSCDYD